MRLADEQKLTHLSFICNVVGLILGLIIISWVEESNSNSTFIALNLYLMIDSKMQKAKIRDRNR